MSLCFPGTSAVIQDQWLDPSPFTAYVEASLGQIVNPKLQMQLRNRGCAVKTQGIKWHSCHIFCVICVHTVPVPSRVYRVVNSEPAVLSLVRNLTPSEEELTQKSHLTLVKVPMFATWTKSPQKMLIPHTVLQYSWLTVSSHVAWITYELVQGLDSSWAMTD